MWPGLDLTGLEACQPAYEKQNPHLDNVADPQRLKSSEGYSQESNKRATSKETSMIGETPFHMAGQEGQFDVVELMDITTFIKDQFEYHIGEWNDSLEEN